MKKRLIEYYSFKAVDSLSTSLISFEVKFLHISGNLANIAFHL